MASSKSELAMNHEGCVFRTLKFDLHNMCMKWKVHLLNVLFKVSIAFYTVCRQLILFLECAENKLMCSNNINLLVYV